VHTNTTTPKFVNNPLTIRSSKRAVRKSNKNDITTLLSKRLLIDIFLISILLGSIALLIAVKDVGL